MAELFPVPYALQASEYGGVLGSKLSLDNADMLLAQRAIMLESAVSHPSGDCFASWAKASATDTMFGFAVMSWAAAHARGCWLRNGHYQERPRMAELYRHFWTRRDKYLAHSEIHTVVFGSSDPPYPLLYAREADDLQDLVRFARDLCLDEMGNLPVGRISVAADGSIEFIERPLRESDLDPDDIDALGLAWSEIMLKGVT